MSVKEYFFKYFVNLGDFKDLRLKKIYNIWDLQDIMVFSASVYFSRFAFTK